MDLQKRTTPTAAAAARNSGISRNEEVLQRCLSARHLEGVGEYEAARAALGDLWQRVGERPKLAGLDQATQAEVLLRAGTLSGWIGSVNQIEGAQEIAKDLISESARNFESLGSTEKLADAQIDLAVCYWREGALDEARVTLREVLSRLSDGKSEQRLRALATTAFVEWTGIRYKDALRILVEAAPLFEESSNHALRGNFHNSFATVLKNLGQSEGREDYIDRAFIEYAAASYHFEQAGHTRYLARVENNLGMLFLTCSRFVEAHQHLNRARAVFVRLKDKGSVAQVDDTRAKAFLGQSLNGRAEMLARTCVRTLEEGDELSLLTEALTTHGIALARMGNFSDAQATLQRAIDVAQRAGAPESGAIAALCVAEELQHLSLAELIDYYRTAESLLAQSQRPGMEVRLGECARRLLKAEAVFNTDTPELFRPHSNVNGSAAIQLQAEKTSSRDLSSSFSLEEEVLHYESDLIKRALEASAGSVTKAARLLGLTHQGLAFILNGRQKELLSARTPVKRRRRSIIRDR